jgi:hypothetical protein
VTAYDDAGSQTTATAIVSVTPSNDAPMFTRPLVYDRTASTIAIGPVTPTIGSMVPRTTAISSSPAPRTRRMARR